MDFHQLVSFVRQCGCQVRLYDRVQLKVNECEGTFQVSKKGNPVISMATKGLSQRDLFFVLLHEFAHYLQWRTGYFDYLHGASQGWDTVDKYIRYKRKKVGQADLSVARNVVLAIEYDAEMRTIDLARFFNIELDEETYIRDSNNYILQIKWATENKKWDYPAEPEKIEARVKRPIFLFHRLTKEEKKIMEGPVN
jgi:hypothetical protein